MIHLEGLSDQKAFKITIDWEAAAIQKQNKFNVTFYDPDTGKLLEDIEYDFIVSDASGNAAVTRLGQHDSGQTVIFPHQGSYSLNIKNIEGLGEDMKVPIQVSPEFPIAGFLAPALIVAIAFAKLSKIYLDGRLK